MRPGTIISNANFKEDYFRVEFYAPDIAATAQAGSFVHVRIANCADRILRRPFSICSTSAEGMVTVIYKVVGAGTQVLSTLGAGVVCDLLGPLGVPFGPPQEDEIPILVGGGYGSAAMFMLSAVAKNRGVVLLGARNERDLILVDEYRARGFDVRLATDDGTAGMHGYVTGLIDPLLQEFAGKKLRFYACGPTPMLITLSKMMIERDYPEAEVSLDHLMCCGVGACFACVVKIKDANPDGFRYARTCSEGPVFKAAQVYTEV